MVNSAGAVDGLKSATAGDAVIGIGAFLGTGSSIVVSVKEFEGLWVCVLALSGDGFAGECVADFDLVGDDPGDLFCLLVSNFN